MDKMAIKEQIAVLKSKQRRQEEYIAYLMKRGTTADINVAVEGEILDNLNKEIAALYEQL